MLVVAVIAPGAMGAAVGQVLARNGVEVRTLLAGRSPDSVRRAEAAGMRDADLAGVARADIVLSIVPPGEALALAEQLAPAIRAHHDAGHHDAGHHDAGHHDAGHHDTGDGSRPGLLYADCNAVSPQTVGRVEAALAGTGARFVDAAIVGGPPREGAPGPVFYASGAEAGGLAVLGGHGLTVKRLDGPVGAASGLKMSYAGITKGFTALGAAMMLAATRFGAADDLAAELADSQPEMLARFGQSVPTMYPKAYRWVAEMEEIAAFAGDDEATRQIYLGIAALYERLARDQAGPKQDIGTLDAFLRRR